jgi:hypothetical protein
MGLGLQTWSLEMLQILGLSVALLLLGSGVWANFGGGSLSQNKGDGFRTLIEHGLIAHALSARLGVQDA